MNRRGFLLSGFLSCLAFDRSVSPSALAATIPRGLPIYRCPRVAPFEVDGELEKRVWAGTPAASLSPATGKPDKVKATTIRLCWSASHLYAAFECADDAIRATYTRRDSPLWEQDVVELFLNPGSDPTRYIELECSPNGVLWDGRIINPTRTGSSNRTDLNWSCDGWRVVTRTKRDGSEGPVRGWTVEMAIPFSGLEVPRPRVGDRWRANFYRIDLASPVEYSAWSPTLVSPASYHRPDRFGWLHFDRGPGRALELRLPRRTM